MNSFNPNPVKLVPCMCSGAGAELFVVEGDSASAAVAAVRQPQFQAVLPMQGKPLNAWRASAARVQAHGLFQALRNALAIPDPSNDKHSPTFDRVLLLFDPDADGIHCGALMVLYCYRWLRPFFDAGRVELVHAPLFEISYHEPNGQEQALQAFTEIQQREICDRLQAEGAQQVKARRYRGLGGVDPTVLRERCVDPATRKSRVLRQADAQAVIEVFGGPAAR